MWEISLALGVRHGVDTIGLKLGGGSDDGGVAALLAIGHGFSDRLEWAVPLPAFAYRGGEAGRFEWIPKAGLIGFSFGSAKSTGTFLAGTVALGIDLRFWLSSGSTLQLQLWGLSGFQTKATLDVPAHGLRNWDANAGAGYSYLANDTVTLNVGVFFSQHVLDENAFPKSNRQWRPRLQVGSLIPLAFHSLPLVRVHLGEVVSLDGYAGITLDLAQRATEETYMLGTTFIW